jgi:uncharacterized protein YgbK (DUF1537 family)
MTHFHPRWQVKKMDSTLRGNIGSELEKMMQVLGCTIAVVAPAFPAAGRVTREGCCYVYGTLLTETEFASDPKTPVAHADIATLIGLQSTIACHHETIHTLGCALRQADSPPQVLIVDAQTNDDLDSIIATVVQSEAPVLLAGSAGLCDALARHLAVKQHGPLLAVVGSMSEIAQQQIAALRGHPRIQQIEIDINKAFTGDTESDVERVVSAIQQNRHCIVSTPNDANARRNIDELCRFHGKSRTELGEQICRHLAQLLQLALNGSQPGALYLSGGDVAIAVATRLKATGFQIIGRVAQCVPYGHFLGSSWQGPVMTKAGGFGSETTLREVVDFIEEKMSD